MPGGLRSVESYIKEELQSYGLDLEPDSFFFSGQKSSNWIARLKGFSPSAPRLIIGAHYDAVPGSPGADDNASGMAVLLETARVYAAAQPRWPGVEFAAFNMEEYGMIGSRNYAARLKKEKIEISGMVSLEMVGFASEEKGSQKMPLFLKPFYPEVGNFIGLVANTRSIPLLKKVEKIFRTVGELPLETLRLPANGWIFPDARLSDHSSFWDQGYPALLVTDTSFFRNPYYHTEEDTVATLNLDFLCRVAQAAARLVCEFNP